MIEKIITLNYDDPYNFCTFIDSDSLTKIASTTSKEISDFIANLKKDTNKYVYVLINAMGAEEIYGDNNNHDSFPEYLDGKLNLLNESPEYGYKTFQTNAHLFKHHRNKNPENRYGDVLLSVYNHKMHRPELVVRIDKTRAPEEAKKIEQGGVISTSMGAKVPYDICSICGNKAKTRKEYCVHLKTQMGKILPDGRKVFAINPKPKFFDISMVFVPADSTSRVMKKLASLRGSRISLNPVFKVKTASEKFAEIKKRIAGGPIAATGMDNILESLISRKLGKMKSREISMSTDRLNSLAKHPLPKILSTMAYSGIVPKPHEFQRIILIKMNKPKMADMLDETNLIFDRSTADADADVCRMIKVKSGLADRSVFSEMKDIMPYRSVMQPHMMLRLAKPGMLMDRPVARTSMNINPIMSAIAGMYNKYMHEAPSSIYSTVSRMLGRKNTCMGIGRPGVIPTRFPSRMNNSAEIGNFLAKSIHGRFGNKLVDLDPLSKITYFLKHIIPSIGRSNHSGINVMIRNLTIGIPMMSYDRPMSPLMIKTSSVIPSDEGRRWIMDVLTEGKNGFEKNASKNIFRGELNEAMMNLISNDDSLFNVVTLTKLGELV